VWPVVVSMADVLIEAADDIRQCPGDGMCGCLFVERTKNRSRGMWLVGGMATNAPEWPT
jgi:predicted RNA-binding Zn ribbon-like protein